MEDPFQILFDHLQIYPLKSEMLSYHPKKFMLKRSPASLLSQTSQVRFENSAEIVPVPAGWKPFPEIFSNPCMISLSRLHEVSGKSSPMDAIVMQSMHPSFSSISIIWFDLIWLGLIISNTFSRVRECEPYSHCWNQFSKKAKIGWWLRLRISIIPCSSATYNFPFDIVCKR